MALKGAYLDDCEDLTRRVVKLEKIYHLHSQEISKLSNQRSEFIQNIQNLEGQNSDLHNEVIGYKTELSEQAAVVDTLKANMDTLISRPVCPITQSASEYEMIAGTCYYFETDRMMSFNEAKMNCRTKFGSKSIGKLAEPMEKNINTQIFKMWKKRYPNKQGIIGVTDKKKEGSFVYDSNNKNVTIDFWKNEQPSSSKSCVAFHHEKNGLWTYIPCEGFESYSICQPMNQDEIIERILRIEEKNVFSFCPTYLSNYEIIEGKCYYFEVIKKMSYKKANENCFHKFGPFHVGKLAEPRTLKIDALLYEVLKRRLPQINAFTWIGVNDVEVEGRFVYESDNSKISINDFWQEGEPNDSNVGEGEENCVHYDLYNTKGWNDRSCSNQYYSICEAFES